MIQALVRNVGTCRVDVKGAPQMERLHERLSTEAAHRGGSVCSRDEGAVMVLDRRGAVIQAGMRGQLTQGGFA